LQIDYFLNFHLSQVSPIKQEMNKKIKGANFDSLGSSCS